MNHTDTVQKKPLCSRVVLFIAIVIVWLLIDIISKRAIIEQAHFLGEVLAGPYFNLFDITLIHNTGAAWGIFSQSTMALAVFSLVVCIGLTICCFTLFKDNTILVLIGLALVVGGGIGNSIDRFEYGYVIDFIETTFINFPVFNVADIGVTCGFVLFILGFIIDFVKESKLNHEK